MWNADHAMDGDPGYRDQLESNLAAESRFQEQRELEDSVKCGRKNGCRTRCVYWPGVAPQDSPACYLHLTPTESALLVDLYDRAVAEETCRGRGRSSEPGIRYKEDGRDIRPVDGRWPNIRSCKTRRIHQVRLADFGERIEGLHELEQLGQK